MTMRIRHTEKDQLYAYDATEVLEVRDLTEDRQESVQLTEASLELDLEHICE